MTDLKEFLCCALFVLTWIVVPGLATLLVGPWLGSLTFFALFVGWLFVGTKMVDGCGPLF